MTNEKKSRSSSQLGFAGGGVDRISNLPDSILHHILSFLDAISAVQTCVLSKQWESAWKHVHVLNLELDMQDEYSRYETFVDKFLSLRYPLRVSKVLWDSDIYIWIEDAPDGCQFRLLRRVLQYAVSHGAQHFELRPSSDTEPNTPLFELFDSISDTVTSLELQLFDIYCPPECSCRFQLLTTLKLRSCRLLADGELVQPFSLFPCLKDLVLHHCWLVGEGDDDRSVRLRVSGLELVKLILLDIEIPKLEIFAPKLKSFRLSSEGGLVFSEITVPSLIHADIGCSLFDDDDGNIFIEHLVVMFRGLHNVEFLMLCKEISEAVCRMSDFLEQQHCPFTKLKKLNLELDSNDDIPYKVLDSYFNNVYSNAGLHIQIEEEGL